MIKLRVEWHDTCPGCGLRLVADFLDGPDERQICPWCGHVWEYDSSGEVSGLKDDLARAVRKLEDCANARMASRC